MRLAPHDTYSGLSLIGKALFSPIRRLEDDVHAGGWLMAMTGGLWQLATQGAFARLVWIAVVASAWDYFAGVRLAKHRGTYNNALAHAGWMGKVSGVVLILVLKLLEDWVVSYGGVDTKGVAATALTFALLVAELRSIAHNRQGWGAQPIPVLSPLLDWFDSLASAMIPARRPTPTEIAARAGREEVQ